MNARLTPEQLADYAALDFAELVPADAAAVVARMRNALVGEIRRLRAELERPAVEAKRNEIRSSYSELISQAEQDRDHEGAATLSLQLRDSEAKWQREDEAVAR